MPLSVLIVEDEHVLREALCDILNNEGIAATGVGTLSSYHAWRKNHECDVLLVDRDLPDGDGLEAVRVFRETGHGRAVVISAMATPQHRIQGLDADVDYYIGKPVEPKELLALLRQYEHRLASEGKIGWVFDTRRWCLISPDGQTITLTQSEIRVLSCFVEAAGLPRDRNEIIEALGKTIEDYDPRRLEIMIRRLRNKVKNHGLDLPLATVYGGGYCFTENLRKLE